jgi:glycosyltransferase involved in cell wall biosynthesis
MTVVPQDRTPRRRLALLHWGDLIEDFLDGVGLTFEAFRDEMSGGWMFGYVEALRTAGIETVVVCVSEQVERPERVAHLPTGAVILRVPAPRVHRWLRAQLPHRYAWTVRDALAGARGLQRVTALPARQLAPYLATPLAGLARELRALGCGAVLCQEYEVPRFDVCVLLGRLLRVPVVASFQGGDVRQLAVERLVRRHAVRAAAGVIIGPAAEVSRVRDCYGLPQERIAQVFNPLDVDAWAPVPREAARRELGLDAGASVVAWHGRVDLRRKGLDVLVDAWRRLQTARGAGERALLLVGTGPDRQQLRRLLSDLPGVRWVDRYVMDRSYLRTVLSAADVYAFPSRHEGFPVAPIEAMAAGLPVVAADAPGVRDILPCGEDSGGLVVPRGNAAAFATALERLCGDALLRRRLRPRARQRAEAAFSLPAVGVQLRDFLERAGLRPAREPAPLP